MSFLAELQRGNVIRVGAAYLVVAWLFIQVAETDDALGRFEIAAWLNPIAGAVRWKTGLARAYAWMEKADEAFYFMERAAAQGVAQLAGAATHPLLRKLHDGPRWLPFLWSVGQAPDPLAAFEFDVEPPR